MEVRVWRSFSANNSGSFYLVSRFANRAAAEACAVELRDYIVANDAELEAMSRRERSANRELTLANLAFAARHNLEWPTQITSGVADDDEIELAVIGTELTIYHEYCLGFEAALSDYLDSQGGQTRTGRFNEPPLLSLILKLEPNRSENDRLLSELGVRFGFSGYFSIENGWPPGNRTESFCHARSAGFVGPFMLRKIDVLQRLLEAHGVTDYHLAVDREGDSDRFHSISVAKCLECESPDVEFLDASFFDLPNDQLACNRCDGMFELAGEA